MPTHHKLGLGGNGIDDVSFGGVEVRKAIWRVIVEITPVKMFRANPELTRTCFLGEKEHVPIGSETPNDSIWR